MAYRSAYAMEIGFKPHVEGFPWYEMPVGGRRNDFKNRTYPSEIGNENPSRPCHPFLVSSPRAGCEAYILALAAQRPDPIGWTLIPLSLRSATGGEALPVAAPRPPPTTRSGCPSSSPRRQRDGRERSNPLPAASRAGLEPHAAPPITGTKAYPFQLEPFPGATAGPFRPAPTRRRRTEGRAPPA